jgi:type II secretory pathway pseudopilin PulG
MNPLLALRSVAGHVGIPARTPRMGTQASAGDGEAPATGRDDDGFTLAEVVVSIALFTMVSFAVTLALVTLIKLTGVTQNRVAASNLARQEVEKLRGQNSTLSLLDAAASTIALKGTTFTITPIMSPAANVTCAPGASRNVTVKVSWNDSSTRSVRYDTVLSC